MSQLKYFFIFPLTPSRNICGYFSLKNGTVSLTFIPICIFSFFFILDLFKSTGNVLMIIFVHSVFSFGNFFSFVYIVKSAHQFEYKKAYIGNIAIVLSFGLHLILFLFNTLFSMNFSSIELSMINTSHLGMSTRFLSFTLPNFIYLVFELTVTWVSYSYTRNLSEGKDALVDGQNFDRYIEDFGSDNGSVSGRDNFNSNSNRFKNNMMSLESGGGFGGINNNLSFESGGNSGGDKKLVQNEMF